jgi:CRP-like cAMP-binding protein
VSLSESERTVLNRLQERERQVRRGTAVFRENDRTSEIFVVERGMLMSYVVLDDGSRQILRFLFPGDLAGVASLIYRNCPETIEAVTDATICPFDRAAFAQLFEEHPRLGALILAINQVERVALTDRLAALGRTTAKARVAAILLDLTSRMRRVDRTIGDTVTLGLTQEELGDATGLTAVHVNRMLRQLEDEGLIAREGGRVTFRDEAALRAAASYTDRYENLDLSWLPPGR